jgi:hypothetical protein
MKKKQPSTFIFHHRHDDENPRLSAAQKAENKQTKIKKPQDEIFGVNNPRILF